MKTNSDYKEVILHSYSIEILFFGCSLLVSIVVCCLSAFNYGKNTAKLQKEYIGRYSKTVADSLWKENIKSKLAEYNSLEMQCLEKLDSINKSLSIAIDDLKMVMNSLEKENNK